MPILYSLKVQARCPGHTFQQFGLPVGNSELISERKDRVSIHLSIGLFKNSMYQDVNPVPNKPLLNDLATTPSVLIDIEQQHVYTIRHCERRISS